MVADRHCPILAIDLVKKIPVFQMKVGISCDHLALELKLDDRHGFLHLSHGKLVPYSLAVAGETGGQIIGPDGSDELFQWRHGNSVTHLKLKKSLIAERNPQDIRDASFLAQRGAHPGDIMISPRNRDVGLMHHIVNCLVNARTAVTEI